MAQFLSAVSEICTQSIRWWTGELALILPANWRNTPMRGRAICIAFTDDGMRLGLREGQNDMQFQDVPENRKSIRAFIDELTEINKFELPVELRLLEGQYLTTKDTYPAGAQDKLAKLTGLEIERKMPFGVSDVYFDAGISCVNPDGSVVAEQAFAKRQRVDDFLARADALDLAVSAIRVDGTASHLDLFPGQRKQMLSRKKTRRLLGASFVFAASILLCIFALAARQERALNTLQTKVTAAQKEAVSARALINTLENAQSKISSLRELKQTHPSSLQVWEDLSHALPDSAWLTEFKLNGEEVRISGYARAAASLVNVLEAEPTFHGVGLPAPVTLDQRENRERFTITFTYKRLTETSRTALLVEDSK